MRPIISTAIVFIVIAFLFSFSPKPGGEGFEIYLNNKVVTQQFGNDMNTVKSLQLTQVSADDKLTVRYHHCGRVGKNRVITIKDEQNKTLKEFHYNDATTGVSAMEIKVKEILNLRKSNNLKLYYTSTELPGGRCLASLQTGSNFTNP